MNRRNTRKLRERESLKAFSDIFPGCKRIVYERDRGIDAVLCLDCGNCLFVDLGAGIVSIGWLDGGESGRRDESFEVFPM